MAERKQSAEALLGMLIILGLVAIGYLVVKYGRIQNRIQEHYQLTVEMSDATGIRTGVPVRLGGVLIGEVAGLPQLKADYSALEVPLRIYMQIKIPSNARVSVGASGLMGDNYVKFNLPPRPSSDFIAPGTTLQAGAPVGLKALQSDAEGILSNVNASVSDLNDAIERLDRIFARIETILEGDDTGNLKTAISDLSEMAKIVKDASLKLDPLLGSADVAIGDFRESAVTLKETTGKLDPLFTSADETITEIKDAATEFKGAATDARRTVATAEQTFITGNEAIQDIAAAANKAEPTMDEIRQALEAFRGTLEYVDQLASATEESKGLIKALWDDPELKKDFKNLIDKMEANGLIFYPRDKEERRPFRSPPSRN